VDEKIKKQEELKINKLIKVIINFWKIFEIKKIKRLLEYLYYYYLKIIVDLFYSVQYLFNNFPILTPLIPSYETVFKKYL